MFDPTALPGWHDWLGIVLTIGGFITAFVQLAKTRTAAETAARKLAEATQKLNADQLGAVVPQLATIVADMDFAIDANDREVAHRALLRFSHVAREASGLLAHLTADHTDLQSRLVQSIEIALDVKGNIVGRVKADVPRLAKPITAEIRALSVELAGVTVDDRFQLGEVKNV
jgi:hypothetical protein